MKTLAINRKDGQNKIKYMDKIKDKVL